MLARNILIFDNIEDSMRENMMDKLNYAVFSDIIVVR